MKILVLSCQTESLINFRLDMMRAFVEAGCEVIAVGHDPSGQWNEFFENVGISYRAVPVNRNGMDFFEDQRTLKAYKDLLEEIRPDKVFAYQTKAVIYGGLAVKAYGKCGFYPLIAGLGYAFSGQGIKRAAARAYILSGYRKALKNADMVLFHNEDDREALIKKGVVKRQKSIVVNGSGVDMELFKPCEKAEKKQTGATCFIMVARIIKDKGIIEYLEASRSLRKSGFDVECKLVGGFDTNPSAMKQEDIEPYVLEGSVAYLGEAKNVAELLRESDVFVLPSYHEGRPKAVLEAMATGLAVITTDVPGCRDCIEKGANGILVKPRSSGSLAYAMKKLAAEPELVKTMGKASRRIAEEKYDVGIVNREIMEIMGLAK